MQTFSQNITNQVYESNTPYPMEEIKVSRKWTLREDFVRNIFLVRAVL